MIKMSRLGKAALLAFLISVLGASSVLAQQGGGGDRGRGGPGGSDRGRRGPGGGFSDEMRERFQNMSDEERTRMRERMGGRGGGDRGPQNAEERWAMMSQRFKEGFSDDEWKIVEPRLKVVMGKRREMMTSRFSGYGRGRGGESDSTAPETTASKLRKETGALRDLVRSENPSNADLKTKMTAIRTLRKKLAEEQKKLEAELKALRAKLQEVLSVKQEALFMVDGTLE